MTINVDLGDCRIDSSLNLYEHCVACDDENNYPAGPALRGLPCGASPAGPALRGQPCGAAYPAYPAFDLRCTPLFEGVKTPRKAVYIHILSPKMASHSALRLFTCPKGKTSAFWRIFILAVPRQNARFVPILAQNFEAIFGLHLAVSRPTGQLWAPKWA